MKVMVACLPARQVVMVMMVVIVMVVVSLPVRQVVSRNGQGELEVEISLFGEPFIALGFNPGNNGKNKKIKKNYILHF